MRKHTNKWQTAIVVGFGMPTSGGHLCLEHGAAGALAAGAAGEVRPRSIGGATVDTAPIAARSAARTFAFARTHAWSPPV